MGETFDASVGGRKGLLYVGYGAAGGEGGGGEDAAGGADAAAAAAVDAGTMIRFVRSDDGDTHPSFDASRLLSCEAKGRYRMIVVWDDAGGGDDGDDGDGEPGEKKIAIVRVHGTAVDRVIGAVLDLAEMAKKGSDRGDDSGGGGGGAATKADVAPAGATGTATTAIAAAPAPAPSRPQAQRAGDGQDAASGL